ncbi:TetR/AcrR family transcriptional regulator [Mycolicibacterium austroafricanum]|nr:TetR/AcrR family transcriptional regulator [Mycolicibacterium austroafricanum]
MQKDLTRTRVIDAALELFDERDFASTTMDDIATAANLNRGTIYLHFDSKAEILRTALDVHGPDEFELFEELAGAQSRTELEATYDHALTLWRRLGRIWRHARDAATTDASVRQWRDDVFARQVRQLQQTLEKRGVTSTDAEVRAVMIVSMWSEFMPRWAFGEGVRGRKVTVTALCDFLEAALKPAGPHRPL